MVGKYVKESCSLKLCQQLSLNILQIYASIKSMMGPDDPRPVISRNIG